VELGSPDADVLEFATDHGYVVLTNDTDFVDRNGHSGVFFYEDQQTSNRELLQAIRTVEDLLTDENIRNRTIFLPDGWA
jgi:predicted nuclease of predicted toxin-antitoxin system